MSKMCRSLGKRKPACFPTAPEYWVEFSFCPYYGTMHHVGKAGLFLDEFLDVLENWAASRNFDDHIFIEDIESACFIRYPVNV